MAFTIVCGDEKIEGCLDYNEKIIEYSDYLLNSEDTEQDRYINIIYGLMSKQNEVTDNGGVLLPEAELNKNTILAYVEKVYYKSHLLSYENLKDYVYEKINEKYNFLNEEAKNRLMDTIIDNALDISNNAQKIGAIPGGLCRVEEVSDLQGTPKILFVEKVFLDELINGKGGVVKDYLHYDFDTKDAIQTITCELEKEEIDR